MNRRLLSLIAAVATAVVVLAFVVGSGGRTDSSAAAQQGPTGVGGNWTPIFDDEFTGSSLNPAKWNSNWFGSSNTVPSDAAGGDDESCASPAEAVESGGNLSLGVASTRCTTDTGKTYPYAGSLVNTNGKFEFTYGFLEAKIYVPTNISGEFVNDVSFWADGTGTWPYTGELDVMELVKGCGANGQAGFAFHFHSPNGAPGACVPSDSTGGWHTFGADWEPGRVTYYYDGRNVGSIYNGITSSRMYLILSQSVDPNEASPNVDPAQVRVGYVRVWQRAN